MTARDAHFNVEEQSGLHPESRAVVLETDARSAAVTTWIQRGDGSSGHSLEPDKSASRFAAYLWRIDC